MVTTIEKKIYVDFYNNNLITLYAKQSDVNSRYVNVVCTDRGKRVDLDNLNMSAFVRMKKSDGTYIFNKAEILNDGTISITLTPQMLSAAGKQLIDIMLLSSTDVYLEDLEDLEDLDLLKLTKNISVISVMPFYLVVIEGALNGSGIESSNELDALVQATSNMLILEKSVQEAERKRQDDITGEAFRIANENARIEAERKRQDDITGETFRIANENARIEAESDRQTGEFGEEYRQQAERNRQTNEQERIDNDELRGEAIDDAILSCTNATNAAIKAAANCESVIDKTGVVLKDNIIDNLEMIEKGYVLDASQGVILKNLLLSLEESVNNLHKVYYGTKKPTSDIGKDGDIYMMIIEEVV